MEKVIHAGVPGFDRPFELLGACHRKIERQLHLITRATRLLLLGRQSKHITNMLSDALQYFAHAIPKHVADEEESLIPRLHAALKNDGDHFAFLLEHLEKDHQELDTLHASIDQIGQELLERLSKGEAIERGSPPQALNALRKILRETRDIYRSHILVEDRDIFPVAEQYLPNDTQREIGEEMAKRRGLSSITSPEDFLATMKATKPA